MVLLVLRTSYNWYNSGHGPATPLFLGRFCFFFAGRKIWQAELLQVLRQRDAELARLREERQHKARGFDAACFGRLHLNKRRGEGGLLMGLTWFNP